MQAHVKTPHTKIDIKGEIHPRILSVLTEVYGDKVKLNTGKDDELVDVFETEWYKDISSRMNSGENMKMYREIHQLTQEELGKKLGGVSRQNISHMERGIRPISRKIAILLSKLFDVPIDRFI